jgi:hypothetical protein
LTWLKLTHFSKASKHTLICLIKIIFKKQTFTASLKSLDSTTALCAHAMLTPNGKNRRFQTLRAPRIKAIKPAALVALMVASNSLVRDTRGLGLRRESREMLAVMVAARIRVGAQGGGDVDGDAEGDAEGKGKGEAAT